MSDIKYILFDAANTLIHKPQLWKNIQLSLTKFGHHVPDELLKQNHKIISECLRFPDKTSREFYLGFNAELLYSLGISPTQELLEELFSSCSYLPWKKFSDTTILQSLQLPLGIISNFNSSLKETISKEFGEVFKHILISEDYGIAKPSLLFFQFAIKETGFRPSEILYIGDSIKLDMEPATKVSLKSILIDRDNVYPLYKNRITSLEALTLYL